MKTTAFTKYHIANGAKMAEFAGYNMPIEFSGINDEHINVREKCGVFDVSHMGEIWVKGPRATEFLQRITTNNVSDLYDGKVQYTTMPNGKGGIVDDVLVYRINEQKYMLCVNAANIAKAENQKIRGTESVVDDICIQVTLRHVYGCTEFFKFIFPSFAAVVQNDDLRHFVHELSFLQCLQSLILLSVRNHVLDYKKQTHSAGGQYESAHNCIVYLNNKSRKVGCTSP